MFCLLHSLLSSFWANQLYRYSLDANVAHCNCFAAAGEAVRYKRKSGTHHCFSGSVTHLASASVDHNMLTIDCHSKG